MISVSEDEFLSRDKNVDATITRIVPSRKFKDILKCHFFVGSREPINAELCGFHILRKNDNSNQVTISVVISVCKRDVQKKMTHIPWPKISGHVCSVIKALMGRALYKCDEYDGWQFATLLSGRAGTGKSTLTVLERVIFMPSMVATLSNDLEENFGLFHYSTSWYASARNEGINQTVSRSISNDGVGETIQVENFAIVFNTNGINTSVASNEYLPFDDSQGQISRRLVCVAHKKPYQYQQ